MHNPFSLLYTNFLIPPRAGLRLDERPKKFIIAAETSYAQGHENHNALEVDSMVMAQIRKGTWKLLEERSKQKNRGVPLSTPRGSALPLLLSSPSGGTNVYTYIEIDRNNPRLCQNNQSYLPSTVFCE